MEMRRRSRACLYLACAVVLGASARGAAEDKTYTLAPKYAAGDLAKYRLKSDMKMVITLADGRSLVPNGIPMLTNMTTKYRIARVDPSGTATVERTVTGGASLMMGQEKEIPPSGPVTVEYDKKGRRKQVAELSGATGMEMLSQLFDLPNLPTNDFYFPGHASSSFTAWPGK